MQSAWRRGKFKGTIVSVSKGQSLILVIFVKINCMVKWNSI